MSKLKLKRPPREWPIERKLDYYSAPPNERGCVLWLSYCRPDGYGEVHHDGRLWRVHRLSWTLRNGPIPAGKVLCHRCDVPACRADDHLFLGTHADNVADKIAKGRHFHGEAMALLQRGEKNRSAKISEADALAIRSARGLQREIAEQYGISQSAVSLIKLGKNWSHLSSVQS